ncbi:calcium-binding protein [Kribbella sp. NPDC002412]
MSSTTRRLRRGLSAAAVAAGIAVSFAGTASAAPAGGVVIDTGQLVVTGTNHADNLTLRVPATDTSVLEVDFGNGTTRTVKRSDFVQIQVNSRGGNDVVRIDYGAEVQPFTVIDTGNGNDSAFGGSGNELFRTGNGNDTVDGNRGADTAFLGNGTDTFIWDPGDGSDVIQGGRGPDTMLFNGSAAAERFAATANGPRLRFTRDVGNIVMNTDNVERVELNALGGADSVTVDDLRGTDVRKVDIDLGAQIDTSGGDSAVDAVTVTGTPGRDHIRLSGSAGTVRVSGLKAAVTVSDAEPTDQLTVNTLTGNDRVSTNRLAPGTITLNIL